eukprot:5220775-Prymnesium_polylepis.1
MSAEAGAAMKAVLAEVCAWAPIALMLETMPHGMEADGAAATHSAAAREEAACKLIGNHVNVLKDVANPSADKNIIGVPLTQLELKR